MCSSAGSPFRWMSAASIDGLHPDAEWTVEQVMARMDFFRELILSTAEGEDPYDRIRCADPMRRSILEPAAE